MCSLTQATFFSVQVREFLDVETLVRDEYFFFHLENRIGVAEIGFPLFCIAGVVDEIRFSGRQPIQNLNPVRRMNITDLAANGAHGRPGHVAAETVQLARFIKQVNRRKIIRRSGDEIRTIGGAGGSVRRCLQSDGEDLKRNGTHRDGGQMKRPGTLMWPGPPSGILERVLLVKLLQMWGVYILGME